MYGGVEEADFDCPKCGAQWTATGTIDPGHASNEDVDCPTCGTTMGRIRCDSGFPSMVPRNGPPRQGWTRTYG